MPGPCRRFSGKVKHKSNCERVLSSSSVRLPSCEVAQHPGLSILAGFDPQTTTLKPRHFTLSPVLARETAASSLLVVATERKPVPIAENATPCVGRCLWDERGWPLGGQVPGPGVGVTIRTWQLAWHLRMVRVLRWVKTVSPWGHRKWEFGANRVALPCLSQNINEESVVDLCKFGWIYSDSV